MSSAASTVEHDVEVPGILQGWTREANAKADLMLISSDNYGLWMESKALAQISPVFEALFDTCEGNTSQPEIRLTDSELESADNLRTCFAVIERLTDDDAHNQDSISRLYRCLDLPMIFFAKKYEIQPMIDGISLHMFRAAAQFAPCGGLYSFVAAALKEWDLFGKLVMTLDESFGGNEENPREEQARRMLDWRAWTPSIVRPLSQIHDGLVWAICQVGTKHAKSLTGQINFAAMGPDLARAMHHFELHPDGSDCDVTLAELDQ